MSVRASIQDLAWLSGTWRGRVGEDVVEEIWGEPVGPGTVGVFRWLKGDDVHLYEMIAVEEADDALWMRLRHFSGGLTPWPSEASGPESWRLTENEGRRAVFLNEGLEFPRRIIYRRTGPDSLLVNLEGTKAGEPTRIQFRFARR